MKIYKYVIANYFCVNKYVTQNLFFMSESYKDKIKKMSFYDLFAQLFNLNYIRYSSLILKDIVLFMKICAF